MLSWEERSSLMPLPKSSLQDGAWYVGRTNQRGMPIGKWDEKKGVFICIKPPEFGQHSLYLMKHVENDDGFLCFEPVYKIDL